MAWSDGVVRLVGAESNKTVHQISTSSSEVTCLGWASNSTVRRTSRTSDVKIENSWKRFISMDAAEEASTEEAVLDLPRDLALIDLESSLPKLSVLPTGGTS